MAGDTERVNSDEGKVRPPARPIHDPNLYQRDTNAALQLEIARSEDGKVVWINVDGVNWLRVMVAAKCEVLVTGFGGGMNLEGKADAEFVKRSG